MRLLTKEEIAFLNKNNVARFGGNYVSPYNYLHESSLDYLVDIVDAVLFGKPMYPEIHHKAAYTFSILYQTIYLQTAINVQVLMRAFYFSNLTVIN